MLEEKNDNLHNADGEELNEVNGTVQNDYSPENSVPEDEETPVIHETEGQLPFAPKEILESAKVADEPLEENAPEAETADTETSEETKKEAEPETIEPIVAPDETKVDETAAETAEVPAEEEHHAAVASIVASNAEEGEHESAEEHHGIPVKNYEELSMEELTGELEKFVGIEKVMSVKDTIEDIRKEFYSKYNHLIEEKKDEHSHDNNGDLTDFEYHFPLKGKFDALYNQYRDKKNSHFKKLQGDLKGNLENRLAIIEELKALADGGENMKDALKHISELRERWKNAGPIPRD